MRIYFVSKNGKVVKWNPMTFIVNMSLLLLAIMAVWFVLSYFQILCHQFDYLQNGVHFNYPNWNAIVWLNNHLQWLK